LYNKFKAELSGLYEAKELGNLLYILFEEYAGLKRMELAISNDQIITEHVKGKLEAAVDQLKHYKPVQYIIGKAWFYGLELLVNENVLIPRPETEELVDWAIDKNRKKKNLKIIDIGTGSGCIAIAIKKHLPSSCVTAIDISGRALDVARKNATKYEAEVTFLAVDILNETMLKKLSKFDIIISNPPYVLESEKKVMNPNVLDYEPESALFVDDNHGLMFYETIVSFAGNHLKRGGELYLEINEQKGDEVVLLLKKKGFGEVVLRKDLRGRDRFVFGRR
ncbi:MAG: peptide chain release factor N(5)-glutamine methyltransferase, partial [Bacteroidales bacterium]|nr:peptide chain release factor N(5)-glutamine methyltransferase [Bacteroidales bacterium]